jgi:GntR family transcriptional regulator
VAEAVSLQDRLAGQLRRLISEGALQTGDPLFAGTVEEYAASLDAPPDTLRRALGDLRRDGLLRTRRGQEGWFVRRVDTETLQNQLADELRKAIVGGQLQPGDRLFAGGEEAYADSRGVSRVSLREALRKLEREGLVRARRGNRGGWFVQERQVVTYLGWTGSALTMGHNADQWFDTVLAHGAEPSQDFFCYEQPAPEVVAGRLNITVGAAVTVRRCVRKVNGELSSVQDTFYPQWLCQEVPELRSTEDIPIGTTALLEQRGFPSAGVVDEVMPRMPTPEYAKLLKLPDGTPLLRTLCTVYCDRGPLRVTVEHSSGDRNRRVYHLGDTGLVRRFRKDPVPG